MKELEKAFKDLERIADAMEKRNEILERLLPKIQDTSSIDANKIVADAVARGKAAINEDCVIPTSPVQPVQNMVIQTPVTPTPIPVVPVATTVIPTTNVVPTYSQDQLATAMGRAIDAGKMEVIQNLMASFGVSNLMELSPDKYNDLALKLKEVGVEV